MVISYLDTSAAMKLLTEEPESSALAAEVVRRSSDGPLVASWLLHTELLCAAHRRPDDIGLDDVQTVLANVALADLTRGDLLTAPTLPGRLRSQDAVHLAVALRLGTTHLLTYDQELAAAAVAAGLQVVSPGA
ncbi:type II toxin-antitoxin system VapC family toxin [Klenkia sp. PcliD-1-E]|uniref:type II toxin-antitoxin system VapC family toxin n=1 Tax=Klenkia sp. PcliD-1-E TaxID=2954492 RepID=UPI00209784EE|nr:type II toxin-antitoxin system VapC family toxin [Klenkia sp. PcliD-1-E]MCO7219787.1 type II toxin-antitoxin system VapC family toxin [Klenkia sp. PcliD-1-E]